MIAKSVTYRGVLGVFKSSLHGFYALFAFVFAFLCVSPANAVEGDVTTIAENITFSSSFLPGLVSAFAYLIGILFVVSGILALKDHVENAGDGSGQTPLRTPLVRILIGGALFALPIVLEALRNTFNPGDDTIFGLSSSPVISAFEGLSGFNGNFNEILDNIIFSISGLPGLISAFAYLAGVVLAVLGLIKFKEHVENPAQTTLKEPVIRMMAAGALFAAPEIFLAMLNTIENGGGFFNSGSTSAAAGDATNSTYAQETCAAGTNTLGNIICGIRANSGLFPAFLEGLSYLFGLVLGIWGIFKVRDHVLNPSQTNVFEGISRFIAGGCFFAIPAVVEVFRNTISSDTAGGSPVTTYNEAAGNGTCGDITGLGVDGALVCAMNDIFAPVHLVLNLFTFAAGMIFIMIGVSRLIKSAQDGARGPGGLGTIMSFLMGGALVSYNELMRAASATFLGDSTTKTYATMPYLEGLDEVKPAAEAVVGAIIKFMIVVGLISFVRGLFIVRSVAEGSNQQASMMAAVTHIIGGALAVNLGPLLNALQQTLGISAFGIAFG